MTRTLFLLTFMMGTICGITAARADTIAIPASQDNTLYGSNSGALSNGAGAYFFVGRTNQGSSPDYVRRALTAFNIAGSIPAGSIINSVTLTLNVSRVKGGNPPTSNTGLHRLLTDWGEGVSNASGEEGAGGPAQTGDATWIHTFYSTILWSNPGADGDYVAGASATEPINGLGFYTWGSTSGMVADVQLWLDAPGSNFGWLLKGNESQSKSAKRYDSRQNPDPGKRPVLNVNFTPPADTGACCFANGDCMVLTESDCLMQGGDYQGDGEACEPNNCPQPMGACCFLDQTCQELTEDDCIAMNGSYQGDGTDCDPNPCLLISGACCFSGASCQVLSPADCANQSGEYQGDGSDCDPNPCPLNLEPYVDPLPIPGVIAPVGTTPEGYPAYQIAMTQFTQQLHRDLPPTTLWGYAGTYPGPIIVAMRDEPIEVTWINDLRDELGNPRVDHYLNVDLCPHGAANQPKTVVHLHGGHVPADVDGYPEHTFMPTEQAVYVYPNNQRAALIWFHDHALGITRLNVYMGLAGAYVIRDAEELSLNLPTGGFEIPLIIQDRAFQQNGELFYPATWQDHFFGDYVLVNGMVWPFLNVAQGKYRFRALSGSNSRAYTLSLDDGSGTPPTFWQIGTDGGLLPAPVPLTELTLASGERADLIIDFEGYDNNDEILLVNSAPAPFPGAPGVGVIPQVMKFVVGGGGGFTDPLPATLVAVPPLLEADTVMSRTFELSKEPEACAGAHWLINGLVWDDITEFPLLDTTEVWSFINPSGVSHPMHLHLDFFQVLDRQSFEEIEGEIVPIGDPVPPPANEAGWKDTAVVNPGEILRVVAQFMDYTGLYPYHCHILEHEDHEMMRQFEVVAPPCLADLTSDGTVNAADLALLLGAWGPNPGNPADLNQDGNVNAADLALLLGAWGACPG